MSIISLYSSSSLVSGAEKMLAILASALLHTKTSGDVRFFCANEELSNRLLRNYDEQLTVKSVLGLPKISEKPSRIFKYFLKGCCYAINVFYQRNEIIIFNDLESLLLHWPLIFRNRIFFYLHDSHKLNRFRGRIICKIVSLFSDSILVVTRERCELLKQVNIQNVIYFPNCTENTPIDGYKCGVIRNIVGSRYIQAIVVGQLTCWKRIERAIKVVQELNLMGYRINLKIYGRANPMSESDIQYEAYLKNLISYDSNISMEGFKSNPCEIYKNADFLISMSDNEPFGLNILESLQFGIPVLTLDGEGPRELISGDVGVILQLSDLDDRDLLKFRFEQLLDIQFSACFMAGASYSFAEYTDNVARIFSPTQ